MLIRESWCLTDNQVSQTNATPASLDIISAFRRLVAFSFARLVALINSIVGNGCLMLVPGIDARGSVLAPTLVEGVVVAVGVLLAAICLYMHGILLNRRGSTAVVGLL